MEGNWQGGAAGQNKYQYNEKELNQDFGLDWNDYGARFYDPALARWTAVDPLAEKFIDNGSYNYVNNRPTIAIDPDGQDIIIMFRSGTGDNTQEYSVRYGSDGKLYDTKTNKEYRNGATKEANAYFNTVKGTLDDLKNTGGVVSEVVNDLIYSEGDHKITNRSKKVESPISMNIRDIEDTNNKDRGGSLTLYDPVKDKSAGIKVTTQEVLGHELKHAYNKQHNIDNSGLDVPFNFVNGFVRMEQRKIRGEEVNAVSFQNVIRQKHTPWLLPERTYQTVNISSKLVVPTLVPQSVPLKNNIVDRKQ